MPPTITSVTINPAILHEGETDILVQATVASETGVTGVYVVAYDPSTGDTVNSGDMTMVSGDMLNGIYNLDLFFPPEVIDGLYQVAVVATDASTVEGDYSTYGLNDESVVSSERNVSGPGGPGGPGEKAECCCNVSINVTAGPVNIYVCGSEKKSNIS